MHYAQLEVKWKKQVPTDILWQEVTALENLIVSSRGGLIGVDTETGDISWSSRALGIYVGRHLKSYRIVRFLQLPPAIPYTCSISSVERKFSILPMLDQKKLQVTIYYIILMPFLFPVPTGTGNRC